MNTDGPDHKCCGYPVHLGHHPTCQEAYASKSMRRVVLESPFRGDIIRNVHYARRATHDSILRGESPSPMHLVHPQPGILDDNVPEERELGIRAHMAWIVVAEAVVCYTDYGISGGMQAAIDRAKELSIPVEYREIGSNPAGDITRIMKFPSISSRRDY